MITIIGAIAASGVLLLGILFIWLNERIGRGIVAEVFAERPAPPARPVAGVWRAYRTIAPVADADEEVIMPVRWREDGELLPAASTRRPAPPAPEWTETRTPTRAPAVESDVLVPGLQAVATAIAATICAALLAWALGWSWRVPIVVGALALAAGWLWRLGIVTALLWQVETLTGADVTGDGAVGRPAYLLANPVQAQQAVAQEARQAETEAKRAELLRFVDACLTNGTAEGKHGVKAAGPDRAAYLEKRDALMRLGIARWKNPARPRAGWEIACSRARAHQIIRQHVL